MNLVFRRYNNEIVAVTPDHTGPHLVTVYTENGDKFLIETETAKQWPRASRIETNKIETLMLLTGLLDKPKFGNH